MAATRETDPYAGARPEEITALEEAYLFSTYKRQDIILSRGTGAYVVDINGKRYLDFLAGIAVNSLGYAHPRIVSVLADQGRQLIHCSNLFYHPFQGTLAKRLVEISGLARVFFTNSGTEAIEAALKIARAHSRTLGKPGKTGIIALKNSFHGRTLGALSITAQEKYQAPFRPLIPEVRVLEEFTEEALERAFSEDVCALVLEPIQGEAGVIPMPAPFLRAARALCTRHSALLILDEIQCGMGRTGKYFAFQHYGIEPDLVAVAKSLAAGYPLGAVIGSARVAETLKPGEHGTTFGGGPLACRLALEVLDVLRDEQLVARVEELGDYLLQGLRALATKHPSMGEIRGMGLMLGVEMGSAARPVVQMLQERGILANAAHDTVLRLLPPFVITRDEVDLFLKTLDEVLRDTEAAGGPSQAKVGGA